MCKAYLWEIEKKSTDSVRKNEVHHWRTQWENTRTEYISQHLHQLQHGQSRRQMQALTQRADGCIGAGRPESPRDWSNTNALSTPIQMPKQTATCPSWMAPLKNLFITARTPANIANNTRTSRYRTRSIHSTLNEHSTANWRTARAALASNESAATDAQIVDLFHTHTQMSLLPLCCTLHRIPRATRHSTTGRRCVASANERLQFPASTVATHPAFCVVLIPLSPTR